MSQNVRYIHLQNEAGLTSQLIQQALDGLMSARPAWLNER